MLWWNERSSSTICLLYTSKQVCSFLYKIIKKGFSSSKGLQYKLFDLFRSKWTSVGWMFKETTVSDKSRLSTCGRCNIEFYGRKRKLSVKKKKWFIRRFKETAFITPPKVLKRMSLIPVSYTHLDVYKRQVLICHNVKNMRGIKVEGIVER